MGPIVDSRQGWLTPTPQTVNKIGTLSVTAVVGWATIVVGRAVRCVRYLLLLTDVAGGLAIGLFCGRAANAVIEGRTAGEVCW